MNILDKSLMFSVTTFDNFLTINTGKTKQQFIYPLNKQGSNRIWCFHCLWITFDIRSSVSNCQPKRPFIDGLYCLFIYDESVAVTHYKHSKESPTWVRVIIEIDPISLNFTNVQNNKMCSIKNKLYHKLKKNKLFL